MVRKSIFSAIFLTFLGMHAEASESTHSPLPPGHIYDVPENLENRNLKWLHFRKTFFFLDQLIQNLNFHLKKLEASLTPDHIRMREEALPELNKIDLSLRSKPLHGLGTLETVIAKTEGNPIPVFSEIHKIVTTELTAHKKKVKDFVSTHGVYDGLEAQADAKIMAANWYRYAHRYGENPNDYAPLLSKQLKQNLMIHPKRSSLFDRLLFVSSLYKKNGIQQANDEKAYETLIKSDWCDVIQQSETVRTHRRKGLYLRWILEDGGWRLDHLKFNTSWQRTK